MKQPKTTARVLTGKLIAFAALGAYFAVLFVGGLMHGDKMSVLAPDFIQYFHPVTYGIAWLILAVILVAYGSVSKAVVYGFTWVAALCYALRTAWAGGSYYLTFAMCALVAGMTTAVSRAMGSEPQTAKAGKKKTFMLSAGTGKILTAAAAVLCGGGVLFLLLSSYLTYTTTPTVSTGVYGQMMWSLRNGFSFDTTLEFGETVSHMAAHISPIFLVFLPFYAIFPSPVTLMVLQVIAVYSAVIPLWLIAKRRGLSNGMTALLCLLLCLFPAVWGGAAVSFHEYALLLPLLLWLLWAMESHRPVLFWVFAALVLCVRETAAIHLFAVGLYWLITNRKGAETDGVSLRAERRRAGLLMVVSVIYFTVAMVLLTYAGKGTLITRFENVTGIYATDFGTLIREVIFNPALTVYEMLSEAKLHYVLCMLLPLAALPLFSRKKAGLVFLIPFLLLNLLSDFPYHYNLDYPYSFGVSAFILYLTVSALAERSVNKGVRDGRFCRRMLTLSLCFTLLIGGFRLADYGLFTDYVAEGRDEVAAMDELLELVEDGASVSASARLCPNLSGRSELYTLSHGVETDYVVLDLREEWGLSNESKYTVEYYEKLGYRLLESRKGVGAVLERK